jgi:Mn-dependent DtxR family transcriptional regulator
MDYKDFLILDYLSQFDAPAEMVSKNLPYDIKINVPIDGIGPDTLHERLTQLTNRGLIKRPYAKSAIITEAGQIELQRYKAAQPKPSFASLMDRVASYLLLPENKGKMLSEKDVASALTIDLEKVEAIHTRLFERGFITQAKDGRGGLLFIVGKKLISFLHDTSFEGEKEESRSVQNIQNIETNYGIASQSSETSLRDFQPTINPPVQPAKADAKEGIMTSVGKFIFKNIIVVIIVGVILAFIVWKLGWN